jgi:hypothetical protein
MAISYAVISQSHEVGGSETGDISQYDVSQDRVPHKCCVKVKRVIPDNLFWPRKRYSRTCEKCTKNTKWQFTE